MESLYMVITQFMKDKFCNLFMTKKYRDWKRHGRGCLTLPNRNIEDAEWEQDKKERIGYILYRNGDVYKGEFKDNYKNGFGAFFSQSPGEFFLGNWERDQKQGLGFLIFSSWTKYQKAFYQRDKLHGKCNVFNEEPNTLEILSNFEVPLEWNNFEPKIKTNKDIIKALFSNVK